MGHSANSTLRAERGSGDENPNPTTASTTGDAESSLVSPRSSVTPSARPSQVDSDFNLACMIHEQEVAFMRLRDRDLGRARSLEDVSDGEVDWGDYSTDDEVIDEEVQEDGVRHEKDEVSEDRSDAHPAQADEDFKHAIELLDAEVRQILSQFTSSTRLDERRTASQLHQHTARFQNYRRYSDSHDLSYEELSALCEMVGTVDKGLSPEAIASLPSISYKTDCAQDGLTNECVICLMNFEDGDSVLPLPCKHLYHRDCISTWLQTNKVCPICNAEVSLP